MTALFAAQNIGWNCPNCTFENNEWLQRCEMCDLEKPASVCDDTKWHCLNCTFINDAAQDTCTVCGASKLDGNVDSIHQIQQDEDVWQCPVCTSSIDKTQKQCNLCERVDTQRYWRCATCTFINDNTCAHCSMCSPDLQLLPQTLTTQHTQHSQVEKPSPISPPLPISVFAPIFVDFVDEEEKNKQIVVTLSRDNPIQREHFDTFACTISDLNSSWLCINTSFLEKHLDSDNCVAAVTFIEVTQEFAKFVRVNNSKILREIKMAIECQTYQPKEISDDAQKLQLIPIWNHLNECVLALFEMANEFLEVRDEFIMVLMNIMWKSDHLQTKQSVIEKLKENIKSINNDDFKADDRDYSDNAIFKSLAEINKIMPGKEYFESLMNSLPTKANEINVHVEKLNAKYKEYEQVHSQRKQMIETKKTQLANKKALIDQERRQSEQAQQAKNYDLAKTYADRANNLVLNHNQLVAAVDEDIRQLNQFTDNFQNSIKPMQDELDAKKKEYERLLENIKAAREKTGIHGDNLIEEFLAKMNDLTPLSIQICSRIASFEVLISTLSELLMRIMDEHGNDAEHGPTVEWYCKQQQIGLQEFVDALHEKGIRYVNDLKERYKGKPDLFNNELLPYLAQKTGRRIKLGEKRRLKRLCQVNA